METQLAGVNPVLGISDEARRQSRDLIARLAKSGMFLKYRKAYEATTGLPLSLRAIGAYGAPLQDSKLRNPFCGLRARTGQTCAACLRLQSVVESRCAGAEAATAQCSAGLSETAVAIRLGERVVGYLQTGQVFLHAPNGAGVRRLRREMTGARDPAAAAELEAAYLRTRVLAPAQYRSIVRLLEVFAQHLAVTCNQVMVTESFQESPVISRSKEYIAAHQQDRIGLADVAAAARLSPSYFCKMFRKLTGTNLMDYVARVRVETVKGYLLNPHTRISEAAYASGFQTLSQFNRIFRRVTGEPPNRYRARLHQARAPVSYAA